jgi:methylmalonyl-CoA mutase cobalamin-binding domain/chain
MGEEIIESLKKSILDFDQEGAKKLAQKIIDEKVDVVEAISAMTQVMQQIGSGFEEGKYFLPDLFGAADTMQSVMSILEKEIKKVETQLKTLGTVVIGTVFGDIHDIGKTMVSTFLKAEGFSVNDLGVNVTAEIFVDAIEKYNANILALSALLTTTAGEMGKVIEALEKKGLRNKVKIIVGGGAITQEFADTIGADGYDSTAVGAGRLARKLIEKQG